MATQSLLSVNGDKRGRKFIPFTSKIYEVYLQMIVRKNTSYNNSLCLLNVETFEIFVAGPLDPTIFESSEKAALFT